MSILKILAFLLEDRVELITTRQGDKLWTAYEADNGAGKPKLKDKGEVVAYLAKEFSDKHLQKVANWYLEGNFSLEDGPRIIEMLKHFEKVRSKLPKKDLMAYKTVAELATALEAFTPKGTAKELNPDEVVKFVKLKEVKILIDEPRLKVYIPKTKEASCFFGDETKWCTAWTGERNMFANYSRSGDLYIIIANGIKYQFHFPSNSFMNDQDQQLTTVEIDKLLTTYPKLYDVIKEPAEKSGNLMFLSPENLTPANLLKIFENLSSGKRNAKPHIQSIDREATRIVFDWLSKHIKPSVVKGEFKEAIITWFDMLARSGDIGVNYRFHSSNIFNALAPLEIINILKHNLQLLFEAQNSIIKKLYDDTAARAVLVKIFDEALGSDSRVYKNDVIRMFKFDNGNPPFLSTIDPSNLIDKVVLDEFVLKHGIDDIVKTSLLQAYKPTEAEQLKLAEKQPRSLLQIPTATNKAKERARMYLRAKRDD